MNKRPAINIDTQRGNARRICLERRSILVRVCRARLQSRNAQGVLPSIDSGVEDEFEVLTNVSKVTGRHLEPR